ncbi:YbhB/YbcL family Raf kinase inhibitor-like protein [Actinoplanes sp. NPDC020271]|uniref:YbhB/YbcL family Raf kinase inhibitor-like protein n=1 Tax=Actinoplanes sp. NPDC020271 TaxID=3363896 RepID=UPI0037B7F3E0
MSLLVTLVTPLGRLLRNKRPDESLSIRHASEVAAPRAIELRSAAFEHGGEIPDRHCSLDLGPNISPELSWSGLPDGTEQLLFVLEDIDVPMSRPGLHTIALLPADLDGLAEGALTTANPAFRFVPGARGRVGYFGPRPLPGHGLHRYGFHLYALGRAVPADAALPGLPAVLATVRGHVLADGFLEGVKAG